MRAKLYVSEFADQYLRANFQTLGRLFAVTPFMKGDWAFMTTEVIQTVSNLKIPHLQPYIVKDTILLSVVGGSVTFNYNEFDGTYISLNATVTSSPMTIRMFLGRYSEDTVNV